MKPSTLAILASVLLTALLAVIPPACEQPISSAYLLTQPRIMAIRSEPVDLVPQSQLVASGQVTLDALLYLPPGSPAPTYSWSWCASLGATLQCATTSSELLALVDPGGGSGVTINYDLGSSPTAVFSYPVAPALIQSVCLRRPGDDGGAINDFLDDAGFIDDAGAEDAEADGGPLHGLACTGDTWPVSILLTVTVGNTTLQAVRSLTVYLTPPTTPIDTNPTITGLLPFTGAAAVGDGGVSANPGDEADGSVGDAGVGTIDNGAVTLAAQVPVADSELYVGRVPGSPGSFSLDAGLDANSGCGADDAGEGGADDGGMEDGGCPPSPSSEVYESLSLAWYVEQGQLAEATTSMPEVPFGEPLDWSSLLVNRWTPPAQAGTYQMILVVRDNRGGIGWLVQPARVPVP